jgi:galactokinase
MNLPEKIAGDFRRRYNKEPVMVVAPGRINLIGEHTDYNEGFVMPAAIDRSIYFAIAPNQTSDFNFYSHEFQEQVSFTAGHLHGGQRWVNYLMGVVDGFRAKGISLQGVDCAFGGDIPTGAGLSSSAALCCGFGFALNDLLHANLSRLEIARIAQRAEHLFAGVRCGIMDQYASLFGKKGTALFLDCRSLKHEYLPLQLKKYQLLLIDTHVKHALANSAYNQRRQACEEGVRVLKKTNPSVNTLRDASLNDLNQVQHQLPAEVFLRCKFVVEEINRIQKASGFLRQQNLEQFGHLMYETHQGLRNEYEVSCEESDFIVSMALHHRHTVAGARQMGGGFGGCVIALIQKDAVAGFSEKVREKYVVTFKKEPDFYSVNASDGVHHQPGTNY